MRTYCEKAEEQPRESLERSLGMIVSEVNALRTVILRELVDVRGESHIEESLTLFKLQDAIEKSGIILTLEGQEPDKERYKTLLKKA